MDIRAYRAMQRASALNFGLKNMAVLSIHALMTIQSNRRTEYVESIKKTCNGLDSSENELYASDYFDKLYAFCPDIDKKRISLCRRSTPEE